MGLGKTINSRFTSVADLRLITNKRPGDLRFYRLLDYAVHPILIPEGEETEFYEHHRCSHAPRVKLLMTSWHEILLMEIAKASSITQSES